MKKVIVSLAFLAFAVSMIAMAPAPQPADWVRLGSRKVNYQLDRDVIPVGARDGVFTKIKLKVTGGSLKMHKLVVQYGNGTKDEIPLRQNFTAGSESRVIDLEGSNRVIKDIVIWYDSVNRPRNRATVHVLGKRR